ncbi:MAG TPA: pilus assembly protein PilM [Verrucomicrobiae bacterium]|nr:pilus assembly protein PilM [Verrucomicrobiae bacterium]
MALPFLKKSTGKKRTQIISVDLGSRTTKAVFLEQRGAAWALCRYALLDAPIFDKKISPELLAEHLKAVVQALETDAKYLTLSVSLDDAVVRQLELPQIPIDEMRMVLKNNTKGYLQQDLPGHVFDCYIFPPKEVLAGTAPETPKVSGVPKFKVLVTGAKQQLIADYQEAITEAGLVADYIVPGLVGPINAFEMALPEVFNNETVALVDIGFKHTSVCLLDRGELALMRVVNIGGDKITAGLAEVLSISYAEADGIKVGMAPEVQSALEMQVMPLGRELRASLDFFEHQHDRPVTQVYLSGGSACSEMILEILRAELIVECKTWNPTRFLQLALPGPQSVEIEHVGSQLAVAVGAALVAL